MNINKNAKAAVLSVIDKAKAGVKADKVHIILGEACTGKSYFADQQHGDGCAITKTSWSIDALQDKSIKDKQVLFVEEARPGQLTTQVIDLLLAKKPTYIFLVSSLDILQTEADMKRVEIHLFNETAFQA